MPPNPEPTTKPTLRSHVWATIIAIFVLSTGLVGMNKGYSVIITDAKAEGIKAAADAGKKAEAAEKRLDDHIEESQEIHKQMRREMYNVQLDMRELYKAQMYGVRSARLELPPAPPKADAGDQ